MNTLAIDETVKVPLRTNASGVLLVGGTRIPFDTVVIAFEQGSSPEQIAEHYPGLDLADIYLVIGYYLTHRAAVEEYLRKREAFRAEVRREVEARCNPAGFFDRLRARMAKREKP